MMQVKRRQIVAVLATMAFCAPTFADGVWPDRPLKLVVPYPAGGGTDFSARLIAQALSKKLGQTVIVENKTGASGAIGAQSVVQSKPDGYSVLFASPAEVLVSRIAGQKTSYDPDTELEPITLAGELPLAIVVNPATPAKTLQELLSLAQSDSSTLSYGSPGTGSTMQFAGEQLNISGHAHMLHVPYRGAAPAIADLLGNQIPVAVVGLQPVLAPHKAGTLRVLATTGAKRSSALPDVPAVAELPGFEDYRFTNWFGVYVAKGTPQPIVQKLSAAFQNVLHEPVLRDKLLEQGVEPIGNTPQEFRQFLVSEKNRYEAVQKKSGITLK